MAGEHRIKRGKNVPYEEAIGIPLMIRGPGVGPEPRRGPGREPRPRRHPARVRRAPRFRPSSPARPTGVSQVPVLAGAPPDADRAVLIEGRDNVAKSRHGFKVRSYVGVRTARYAYFEYRRANYDAIAERDRRADRSRADARDASSTTSPAIRTSSATWPATAATRPRAASSPACSAGSRTARVPSAWSARRSAHRER